MQPFEIHDLLISTAAGEISPRPFRVCKPRVSLNVRDIFDVLELGLPIKRKDNIPITCI
jgi:hypothetical protein